ncbi:MAG: Calx-beta domain-containing protein [Planctomycetaceae bacterium]
MQLTDWLASWLSRGTASRRDSRRAQSRRQETRQIAAAEALEPRELPAVITVTSLADTIANDGQVTLREAIQTANNDSVADTIQFASSLTSGGPATIKLSNGTLVIRTDMSIIGPGADRLTIDGNLASRVLAVDDNNNSSMRAVLLSGLTISNGRSNDGGGLANWENLTLDRVTVSNNATTNGYGGGIRGYREGTLTILQSLIANNATTNGGGGGIQSDGPLTIRQSTIRGNFARNGNGGGIRSDGTLTVAQSTISENTSDHGGAGIHFSSYGATPPAGVVSQSTISANTALSGSGALVMDGYGSFSIVQCTIVANSARDLTGGLVLSSYGVSFPLVTNTIVSGNTLTNGVANDVYSNRTLTSASRNNLIGDPGHAGGLTNGANGNIVGNGSGGVRDVSTIVNRNLTDNGGPVKTHAFVIGSPAINAGSNGSIPVDTADRDGDGNRTEADPFDARGSGFARIVGSTVDIGAFEQSGSILPLVTIAATTASVTEDGAANLLFTFTRQTTTGPLTVNFDFSGTATRGTDYTTSTGFSVTFVDGASTAAVTIDPLADSRGENSETVVLTMLSGTGYQVGFPTSASGTIQNDDASVSIVATNATRQEPDSGTTPFTFTVSRTVNLSQTGSVDYSVTGSGPAPANAADFGGSLASGTLSFAVGESTKTITLPVSGDLTLEDNEGFTVTLSNPIEVGIATATAVGLIKNNDSTLTIIGLNSGRQEGNSGQTPFTFRVTRDGAVGAAASVDYAVTGRTDGIPHVTFLGDPADAADFGGTLPSGTIQFAPSETTKTLTININGDTIAEPDDGFTVTLSNGIGVQVPAGTETAGIIRNDDMSLSITATNASQPEGNGGSTPFIFMVTRTGSIAAAASVKYSVSGSGTNPAGATDFPGTLPSGTINFRAGEGTIRLIINVQSEYSFEPDEGFTVTLSDPIGATLATSSASGTILNDDSAFSIAALNAIQREGNSGTTPFTFTVTRSEHTQNAASVNYTARGSGATPTQTADFEGSYPYGTVSFAAGETSKTATLNVNGNRVAELDESFTVTLSGGIGGSVVSATASGTILNDDTTMSISATDASQLEGDSGTTPLTFTVSRTGDVNVASSVDYQIVGTGNRPATAADFGGTLPSGTLSFAAGETSKIIVLNVSGDTAVESNERFSVHLSNNINAVLGTASAAGVILSEELPPLLAISAVNGTQVEGHSGSTSIEFTVTRTGDVSLASSADYAVSGSGSHAADASDFGGTLPSGTIQFAVGETTQTISVAVTSDSQLEPDEGFVVTLSNEVLADLSTASASGLILNDDVVFSIAATSAAKAEGSSGDTANTFTVTRAGDLSGPASVDYAVSGSGANAADTGDFNGGLATGTLTFAAGEASQIITVNVLGDTTAEGDEGFAVTLSNPVGGQIQTASASGSILDDDGSVSISANSASKNEGHSGNTPFTFTVTRSGSASVTSSVDYLVSGAVAGLLTEPLADATDFGGTLPSGRVTFAPGETSKTINVSVSADSTFESDEGFTVTLANPIGTSISTSSANGTIKNDDAGLSIAALDAIKREGNSGNTPLTFTVTRTGNTSNAVSANYVARGSGANPTSTSDFGGTAPSGTVSFAAGETSKVITINAVGNKAVEPDEEFTVTLTNASSGASFVAPTATGTILNDDTALSIAAIDANKFEGNPALGESGLLLTPFTFTVTRTGELSGTSSAAYRVVGIGNRPANAADFGGVLPSGTVSFAAGESSKDIILNVSGDIEMESNESFTLSLSNSVGAVFGTSSATSVILSEELPPVLSISATNAVKNEGHSGSTPFEFTVSRSGDVSVASSVAFAVTGGGSNPATADDFGGALPSGTINFAVGETTQTIAVAVSGDTRLEAEEGFVVTLSNETTADLGTASASGTILNDDAVLSIATDSAIHAEGISGDVANTFVVTRSGNLSVAATVDYSVTGSGTNGANAADFNGTLPSGTLTFAAGESTKTITINVSGDTSAESDEGFTVTLSNSGTDVVQNAAAPGIILDDDGMISIAAVNASLVEGNSGYNEFTFTITRTGSANVESSFDVTLSGSGTNPANGADFRGNPPEPIPTLRLKFLPTETSKSIGVNIAGDTSIEADETFAITLSNATNASIGTSTATGTILSDDAGLSIAALDAVKREGNSSNTPFTFTVTRLGSSHGIASASYAVRGSGEIPAATADFGGAFPRGTVSFADGETSKTITINVAGNKAVEPDEEFIVTLTNPVGASLVTDSATGRILNDDTGFVIEATDASKLEGNSGETPFTFTVTRIGDLNVASSVNYAVAGSGAAPANATDFGGTLASGNLRFAAGETSQSIVINVHGELVIEPDETFAVTLSSPVGATLTTASATATILTDDVPPTLSVLANTASQAEGNSGVTTFEFTVTRSGNLTETSSFDYAAEFVIDSLRFRGLAPSTADDFGGTFPTGTVSFAVGQSEQTIAINVSGDTLVETDENLSLKLSNAVGATLSQTYANATIENDDTALSITATSARNAEGTAGDSAFTFTVTRTGDTRAISTVDFAVGWDSVPTPTDADDFNGSLPSSAMVGTESQPTGTLTFEAGETSKTITINVSGDTTSEPDENFTVTLSNVTGANLLTTSAAGTILDDDGVLSITSDSASKLEANSGNTPVTFTVTRTGSASVTSSVDYTVSGTGLPLPADATDFGGSLPSGSLTFAPGETSKTITVNISGDTSIESNEGFTVTLANANAASLLTATARAVIINDDSELSISATDASKPEGNTGNTPFTFRVSRVGSVLGTASASYTVRGSGTTPAATADFGGTLPSGTVNFADGEAIKTITINVAGNKSIEPDEDFTVTLSNVVNANLITAAATGTIQNDDAALSITATDANKLEGNSGTTPFTFTVTRTGDLSRVATATYLVSASGLQPVVAADFGGTFPGGSVSFAIGETTQTIVVNVLGDSDIEPDETFAVTLSNAVGTNLVTASATGVILSDER